VIQHVWGTGAASFSLYVYNMRFVGAFLLHTLLHAALAENLVWPQFGFDATHTGRSPLIGPTPGASSTWIYRSDGFDSPSFPAVANGLVYVTTPPSGGAYLNAFHATHGTVQWSVDLPPPYTFVSPPAVGPNGTVITGVAALVVSDGFYNIMAYGELSGVHVWNSKLSGYPDVAGNALPVIAPDGVIYASSLGPIYEDPFECYVSALHGLTGALKWIFTVPGRSPSSSPARGPDGTVYFACDGTIHAIDGNDGSKVWSHVIGNGVVACPVVGPHGLVYVGSWDQNVYALNSTTGAVVWSFKTLGRINESPSVGLNGVVYSLSTDSFLYALSGDTGKLLWKTEIAGAVGSPAIAADGVLYLAVAAANENNNLYAVSSSGKLLWSKSMSFNDRLITGVSIGENATLYLGGLSTLFALGPL
jgi:outer membrane protein assembly factor BamB